MIDLKYYLLFLFLFQKKIIFFKESCDKKFQNLNFKGEYAFCNQLSSEKSSN